VAELGISYLVTRVDVKHKGPCDIRGKVAIDEGVGCRGFFGRCSLPRVLTNLRRLVLHFGGEVFLSRTWCVVRRHIAFQKDKVKFSILDQRNVFK
jgi:hypothetical protein